MIGSPLFAVHISDGVLSAEWQQGGLLLAAQLLILAAYRLSPEDVPRIAVLAAACFIASLIHIRTGPTSVHLLLNGLAGVMLGRRAPLAIAQGLLLQFWLLGHGGLWTLGVNTCVMSIPALAIGMAFPAVVGVSPRRPGFLAGFLLGASAAGLTVGLNFAVLWFGGVADFRTLAKVVLLIHLPVIAVEGLILGFVVPFFLKVRPEMLGVTQPLSEGGKTSSSVTSH